MNILVVDKSKVIRQIIREELERESLYTVIEADNSDDVFRIVETTPIDLITLSVELPGKNGYEVCYQLHSKPSEDDDDDYDIDDYDDENHSLFLRDKQIPIIFITGTDSLEGRKKGFEAGGADFIAKPFQKGAVLNAVNSILQPENKLQGLHALVIDDSPAARRIVGNALSEQGVIVYEAGNGAQGFRILEEQRENIDLIISDLVMPELNGNDFCIKVRKELGIKDIPILILSGNMESFSIIDLFRAGATDYLLKPFIKEELLARIMVHLEVRLLNRKMSNKIRELEEINHQLEKIAITDTLTQLPNRRYFFERFSEANSRKNRYNHTLSLLVADIDNFKRINDSYGHQVGDWILQEFARVLKATVRNVDIVCRVGGEEIGIIATDTDSQGAIALGEKIRSRIEKHEFLKDRGIDIHRVTISVGVFTSCAGDALSIHEIYNQADALLYTAKEQGRNRVCAHSTEAPAVHK